MCKSNSIFERENFIMVNNNPGISEGSVLLMHQHVHYAYTCSSMAIYLGIHFLNFEDAIWILELLKSVFDQSAGDT
jgi:hypothetical protein